MTSHRLPFLSFTVAKLAPPCALATSALLALVAALARKACSAFTVLLGLVVCLSTATAATTDDEKPLAASSAATRSTAEALSGVISSAILGSGVVFRIRLGEAESVDPYMPQGQLLRGLAASEPSPWSLWATPVYTRLDNNIAPLLSDGSVKLLLAGVEYNQDDELIVGLSITRDWADITSTERQPGRADARSSITGTGYTVGPYMVYMLSPAWMLDVSSGFGRNDLESVSDTRAVSQPKDDRSFVSLGFTYMNAVSSRVMFTGKASLSHSRDDIAPFRIVAANGSVSTSQGSLTKLTQGRLGGQLSYEMGSLTPFAGAYVIGNDFSVRSTSALKPKEYSSTVQGVVGVNASSGPIYGAIAYQAERGRDQFRLYAGIRY
jgi:hypothetical protein